MTSIYKQNHPKPRTGGVDRGMWNVLYLFLNHKQFEEPVVFHSSNGEQR